MSNLLAARSVASLDRAESVEIYVGGLPRERRWPFEYKAGFSPSDVIEEYTRPSRIVEHGRIVTRPAPSEPEPPDFEGVGTLEAFNTDGLRSLAYTMSVPFMKEKTLRYPGAHRADAGVPGDGAVGARADRGGRGAVWLIDAMSTLMFPKWSYGPGEEDLRSCGSWWRGVKGGRRERHSWDLLSFYDRESQATSMARTTAFPCAIMARAVASGGM